MFCVEDKMIEARKRGQKIKIEMDVKDESEKMLYELEDYIEIPGIEIEQGLVSAKSQILMVSNYSNTPLKIEKGTPICRVNKAEWKEDERSPETEVNLVDMREREWRKKKSSYMK